MKEGETFLFPMEANPKQTKNPKQIKTQCGQTVFPKEAM